jgi:hypothetical protein
MPKTVAGELLRLREALAALDKEAAGPLSEKRRLEQRRLRADILEEIEALEIALRPARSTGVAARKPL